MAGLGNSERPLRIEMSRRIATCPAYHISMIELDPSDGIVLTPNSRYGSGAALLRELWVRCTIAPRGPSLNAGLVAVSSYLTPSNLAQELFGIGLPTRIEDPALLPCPAASSAGEVHQSGADDD